MTGGTLFTQAMLSGAPVGGIASFTLPGLTGSNAPTLPTATLVEGGGLYTLSIPVNVNFVKTQSGQTFSMTFTGTVVATAPAPPPSVVLPIPEPSSGILIVLGIFVGARRAGRVHRRPTRTAGGQTPSCLSGW